jgi:hypothetical protein
MAIDVLIKRKFTIEKPVYIIVSPLLIILSFTLSLLLNPILLSQSFKFYLANISGILIYYMIIGTFKKNSEIVILIKIILSLLVLQSLIAFLEWKFPVVAKYLIPFGRKTIDPQAYVIEGVLRVKGTILDYELLAEWFLIGSFLSMCLIYYLKNNLFLLPLLCCIVGIMFTATRSVIFLFILGIGIVYFALVVFKKEDKSIAFKILIWILLSCISLLALFPGQVVKFIDRFVQYFHHSSLLSSEAINRKVTWQMAMDTFKTGPTIFGNGLYRIEALYTWAGSSHSLYITLLYKIGIFGLVTYFIFWAKMLQQSWKVLCTDRIRDNWYLVLFLSVSVILMLLNEIKIEYMRYEHTIQFAWLIYALLICTLKQNSGKNENIMVS